MDSGISSCISVIDYPQQISRPYGYARQSQNANPRVGEHDARSCRSKVPDQGYRRYIFRCYFHLPGSLLITPCGLYRRRNGILHVDPTISKRSMAYRSVY